MVEQLCPECQYGNPLDNHFCGQCGASLKSYSIVPRRKSGLTIAGYNLPAEQLKQVGQTVAVSLLAIAAEASMAWLRRRAGLVDATPRVTTPKVATPATTAQTALRPLQSKPGRRVVSVFSQRIIAVWSEDGFVRQTVEHVTWRREP